MFQHTAARRRLLVYSSITFSELNVSTHSRAEAAASIPHTHLRYKPSFNTQPRGGGCKTRIVCIRNTYPVSTHSRAEAAAYMTLLDLDDYTVSTHSRAEAAAIRTE